MKVVPIIAAAAVLCGVVMYFFFRKKNERNFFSAVKCEEIECLSMSDVIKFFKASDKLEKLRKNENCIAVAIKENQPDGSFKVACCIFDKEKNEVVDMENAVGFHAKKLDKDLSEAFGDKPMLVLQ
jgi:hypothetical protein